ncbi:MAG TPA: PfkB family carbohydrate kinase [Trebonia sp.]|nr:PfkB family carbohydrate kinase [Trebonia sp.]
MIEFDVVCVGSVTVDSIAVVDHVPAEDERVESPPFADSGGGPAATAAVTLARLGHRVAFCGVTGADAAGAQARELLDAEGVDTRWLRARPEGRTARSMILVSRSAGTRAIVVAPGGAPDPADVPVAASRWIHADQAGYAAARAALAAAGRGGRPSLSVDGGNPIPGLGLRGVDLYVPTVSRLVADFPRATLPGSLEAAVQAGAGAVVATAGARGAYLRSGGTWVLAPSLGVEVVSTMGAGDVFHGALLAGLVAERDPPEAVTFANAVAALSCRALDGRAAIPSRQEADAFIQAQGRDQVQAISLDNPERNTA